MFSLAAKPETNQKQMKKHVLIFGLIPGVILCINMIIMVNLLYNNPDFEGNDLLGYAAMVVVFSLIFFGVRDYRNKKLGGFISFGRAFKTGALIALVASTLYVVVWLFYYYLFVPDFLDVYIEHVKNMTPASELPDQISYLENLEWMYQNPLGVILVTYLEVLPVGLIVALISALILKKKNKSNDGQT